MRTIDVAINEIGRRIGQYHHNARITDHEVELLLSLHDEGWGYRRLSSKFELSRSHVRNIIKGRSRCQTPTAWRKLQVEG